MTLLRTTMYSAGVLAVVGLAVGAWFPALGSNLDSKKARSLQMEGRRLETSVVAEGRLRTYPGGAVEVSTEVPGLVARMLAVENRSIKQGEIVAELDSQLLKAELESARSRVRESVAELDLARSELERQQRLADTRVISPRELEVARRDLRVLEARHASAEASVAALLVRLSKTRIQAPFDGVVLRRFAEVGEAVQAFTRVVLIADTRRVRVEAEVDEFDAGRVAVGMPVEISAEGFPGVTWNGVVEEVPDWVVEKGLQPRDPSRPVDVRVLQVQVGLKEPVPLKLGQRVEARFRVPGKLHQHSSAGTGSGRAMSATR